MDTDQVKQRYAGRAEQEWERLRSSPITRIEYLITSHILERYLPGAGLVLDAGSGPGRYAIDLARRGYRVVMYDLLLEMLRFGRQKAVESQEQGIAFVGDLAPVGGNIVALPFPPDYFDIVVSLGAPLSHLTDPPARAQAVFELARVARPGGRVLLTGLLRTASYRSMVFWLQHAPDLFDQILTPQQRAAGILDGSQVWYSFATGELEELMHQAGLRVCERVGCEGLANHLPLENLEVLETHERYGPAWKDILLETCTDPSVIGISNHLLVVAEKVSGSRRKAAVSTQFLRQTMPALDIMG